jgi:hypothetical protein
MNQALKSFKIVHLAGLKEAKKSGAKSQENGGKEKI